MAALVTSTLFVSAFLLFLAPPIVAKMVLPLYGGSPMVWNICMASFQIALVAGYACAYATSIWLGRRRQIALLVFIVVLPFAVLPVSIDRGLPPPEDMSLVSLPLFLTGPIGLPLVGLAFSAAVIHYWFPRTAHRSARHPYFLYVASHAGIFAALTAYAAFFEPSIPLESQRRLWAAGYAVFAILIAGCACFAWRGGDHHHHVSVGGPHGRAKRVSYGQRARWVGLAFIPSSLMLAVTTYLSTYTAAVPLLWVVPLVLYLLSLVAAFRSNAPVLHAISGRVFPLLLVVLALIFCLRVTVSVELMIALHILTFVAAAFVAHTRLAANRPSPAQLTEFYLWISLGGMLGGIFNGLVAPIVFNRVLEYPLVLVLASLALPGTARSVFGRRDRTLDFVVPLFIAATAILAIRFGPALGAVAPQVAVAALAVFAFSFRRKPLRFAMSIGALLAAGLTLGPGAEHVLHAERTIFGVYRVSENRNGTYRALAHGTTLHGMQALGGPESGEPLTYYHRQGPFGQAFESLIQARRPEDVAVVGLGVGTLGAYAEPGQRWTFYELDEAVARLARDTKYFNYLERCGPWCNVIIGDPRASLTRDPYSRYDLLVLDAFRSDSVPVHLLTRESLDVYLKHLRPYGVMLFHISNPRLTLAPILGRLAEAHGLSVIVNVDRRTESWPVSRHESIWVAMAKHLEHLGPIAADPRWRSIDVPPSTPLWTDDFSNILKVLGH